MVVCDKHSKHLLEKIVWGALYKNIDCTITVRKWESKELSVSGHYQKTPVARISKH